MGFLNRLFDNKETFWLIGIMIFVMILNTLIFGVDGLKSGSTPLIFHDIYFVIANFHLALFLGVSVISGIYLFRTFSSNFKNLPVNLIFMLSTILLIVILNKLGVIVDNFFQQTSDWSMHPLVSGNEVNEQIDQGVKSEENEFKILTNVLLYTQILLMIFLVFCGFKTAVNYKQSV